MCRCLPSWLLCSWWQPRGKWGNFIEQTSIFTQRI